MNKQMSAKFAAVAFALLINGLMLGSVAYLFGRPAHANATLALAGLVAVGNASPANS